MASPVYSKEDVQQHCTRDDCWMIIGKLVVKLPTDFIDSHPGGPILLEKAGRDGTIMFEDGGHPDSARERLMEFAIGTWK
jgi:cytochrome b involved in lipid metabolism